MVLPGLPGCPSLSLPLVRNGQESHPGPETLPATTLKTSDLVAGIRNGYRFFQSGKFSDSKATFAKVLTQIATVVTESKNESEEVKEMVSICREYITSIRIKAAISEAAGNPVRATSCQPTLRIVDCNHRICSWR